MGYFLLELALFLPGLLAFLFGKVPLTRRRRVRASAARLVGLVLMIPLPLYLFACKQSHVAPLGSDEPALDPLGEQFQPHTIGFVRLAAVMAALACLLAATVLALVTSEVRPRPDKPQPQEPGQ
jgi:hypothetical protein